MKQKTVCKDLRDGNNGQEYVFQSMYQCAKYATEHLGVKTSPAIIYQICNKLNNVKTSGGKLTFYFDDNREITHQKTHGRIGKKYNYKKKTQEMEEEEENNIEN